MADRVELLVAEPQTRLRLWPLLAGAGLVLVALGSGAALQDEAAGPLAVTLDTLDGSALRGEPFVRLHVDVVAQGARELSEVRLSLAGTSALGQRLDALDARGRTTIQVDLVPPCPQALTALATRTGTLDVTVVDRGGRSRLVRLPLPTDGPLERLVRYRCRA